MTPNTVTSPVGDEVARLVKKLRAKTERVHDLSGVGYIDDADCHRAADLLELLSRRSLDGGEGVEAIEVAAEAMWRAEVSEIGAARRAREAEYWADQQEDAKGKWRHLARAALASRSRNAEVGVKALEWDDMEWPRLAASLGMLYRIYGGRPAGNFRLVYPDKSEAFFDAIDEAKAAAQADFDQRILSALSITQPDRGEGEPVAQMLGAWDMEGDSIVWLEGCERLSSGDLLYPHPATPVSAEVTEAARDVLAERRRQVEAEGWTPAHDDAHDKGELSAAAGVYALAAASHDYRWVLRGSPVNDYLAAVFKLWPFEWSWFKPRSRRQDKVKAAALLLADIEREDRAALATLGGGRG